MCSAKAIDAVDSSLVGVLGLTAKDGTPRAVAVTPYVVDGKVTVTTTLAFLAKAKMLRKRPAAALYAGGHLVHGNVTVRMHRDSDWFDSHIRAPEASKYPPAKSLLAIPFHRRILWWYVGRVSMTFESPAISERPGGDGATLTYVADGEVQIVPLDADIDIDIASDEIDLGIDVPDGPGCLLVHHETEGMAELLAVTVRGDVKNNRLRVNFRTGSLQPTHPGTLAQLKELRTLAQAAKANRAAIDAWPTAETTAT